MSTVINSGIIQLPSVGDSASARLEELALNNTIPDDQTPPSLPPPTSLLLCSLKSYQAFTSSKQSYYAILLKTTANNKSNPVPTFPKQTTLGSSGDASQYFQNQCWHKLCYASGDHFEGEHFYGYSHGIGMYDYARPHDDDRNKASEQVRDCRRIYYGGFYGGLMEGPGCEVIFIDDYSKAAVFEGIYKAGQRFGPGVLRHMNGSADVGLWKGEHLAQFFFDADDSFTMADFPDMMNQRTPHQTSPSAESDKIQQEMHERARAISQEQRFLRPRNVGSSPDCRYFTMADCEQSFDAHKCLHMAPKYPDNQLLITYLMNSHTMAQTSALDDKMLDEAFVMRCKRAFDRISTAEEAQKRTDNVAGSFVYWSKNLLHEKFQKFAALQLKISQSPPNQRSAPSLLSFDLMNFQESAVNLANNNNAQWTFGEQERLAKQFIDAATHGNAVRVQQLLFDDAVYIDVADNNGYNALIGAAVNRHYNIVNLLLDLGANVNHFTNENMTALSACATLYFSFSTKFNAWLDELRKKAVVAATPVSPVENDQPPKSRLSVSSNEEAASERGLEPVSAARSASTAAARKPSLSASKSINGQLPSADQPASSQTLRKPSTSSAHHQRRKAGRASVASVNNTVAPPPIVACDSLDSNQPADIGIEVPVALIATGSFDSMEALKNYRIRVSDQQLQTAAITLSTNDDVLEDRRDVFMSATRSVQHQPSTSAEEQATAFEMLIREKVLYLAFLRSEQMRMRESIRLLLKRGANPNFCEIPMPLLFLAMKGADTEMVRMLLAKNIDANQRLRPEMGGLTPLHAAMAVPGAYALEIARLLLEAGADPNSRDYFDMNTAADSELQTTTRPESDARASTENSAGDYPGVYIKYEPDRQGYYGRTPLHVVATRDCSDPTNINLVDLLKSFNADLNKIFSNETPLAEALRLYNDNVVEALLNNKADANVRLGAQRGTALCVLLTRPPLAHHANQDVKTLDPHPIAQEIIRLVDLLITAGGADVLAAVDIIGDGLAATTPATAGAASPTLLPLVPQYGTAVDYAFAHFARHKLPVALNSAGGNEDALAKVRKIVLEHVANLLREEVKRTWPVEANVQATPVMAGVASPADGDELRSSEAASVTPDQVTRNVVRTSKTQPAAVVPPLPTSANKRRQTGDSRVGGDSYRASKQAKTSLSPDVAALQPPPIRMTDLGPELYRYCYCCGRHCNVKLSPCPRCGLVFYCSKQCRTKNWNAFHKDECQTPAEIAEKAAAEAAAAAARAGQLERDGDGSSVISIDGDANAAAASLLLADSKGAKPGSVADSGGGNKKGGKQTKQKPGSRGASEGGARDGGGKKGKKGKNKNLGANAFKPVKSGKFGHGSGVSGTSSHHSMMGRGLMGDAEHSAGDHILSRQNLRGAKSTNSRRARGGADDGDGSNAASMGGDVGDDDYHSGRGINLGGNIDREQILGMATHFATLFGHLISRLVTRGDLNLAKFDDIVELQTSEYFMRFATSEEINRTLAAIIVAEANRTQNSGLLNKEHATDLQLKQQSVFDRMERLQAPISRKSSLSEVDGEEERESEETEGGGAASKGKGGGATHKAVTDANYSLS